MTEHRSYLLALLGVMAVTGVVVVLQPAQAVPIIGFGTLIAAALLQLLQGSKAAIKVDQVATALRIQDDKVSTLATVTKATHTLVNSNYGASLLATLLALKHVARLTVDPADRAVAEAAVDEAERLYMDHQRKQALVDSGAAGTL